MKTIEQKAKAYDEALEKAKCLIANEETNVPVFYVENIKDIFPELKESEDERIRGAIIDHLKDNNLTEWAAWLEKQGEQKQDPCEHCDDVKLNCYNFPCIKKKAFDQGKSALEAVKEEKVDNANKVEPKFKVGDWVVYCNEDVDLITGIEENGYCINNGGYIPFVCASDIRLWTNQDAKDGDVLSDGTTIFIFKDLLSDGSVMSYCDYDTDSGESDAFCPLSMNLMCSKITPATREQRDTLERAITNAGYRWDKENLKLKKI